MNQCINVLRFTTYIKLWLFYFILFYFGLKWSLWSTFYGDTQSHPITSPDLYPHYRTLPYELYAPSLPAQTFTRKASALESRPGVVSFWVRMMQKLLGLLVPLFYFGFGYVATLRVIGCAKEGSLYSWLLGSSFRASWIWGLAGISGCKECLGFPSWILAGIMKILQLQKIYTCVFNHRCEFADGCKLASSMLSRPIRSSDVSAWIDEELKISKLLFSR